MANIICVNRAKSVNGSVVFILPSTLNVNVKLIKMNRVSEKEAKKGKVTPYPCNQDITK
jgi:hypothetical protein